MSVHYFLYASSKHKLLINSLEEIIDIYDAIINEAKTQPDSNYNKEDDILLFESLKQQYKTQLYETDVYYKTLKNMSQTVCEHNYTIDTIDITPEKSNQIEYCMICGHTK